MDDGRAHGTAGFTLTETIVSAGLMTATMAIIMGSFIYVLAGVGRSNTQSELDINVQTAMERLKLDLRASALDRMLFYPAGPGPYSAVSFPGARDSNGDGVIERDAWGQIIWDRTLILHVWNGSMRLTIFDPRNNTLTDAQRQAQLNAVVAAGNGASTYNSANAKTINLFQNPCQWSIRPRCAQFDAYSPEVGRRRDVVFGCGPVSNGPTKLTFTNRGGQQGQGQGVQYRTGHIDGIPFDGPRGGGGPLARHAVLRPETGL